MSVEHSNKPLEEQLLYKLGALEGTVVSGMRRIDEQLTVLVDNFVKHQTDSTAKTDALERRVQALEDWKLGSKVRVATIISAFTVVWAVFSGKIEQIVNSIL